VFVRPLRILLLSAILALTAAAAGEAATVTARTAGAESFQLYHGVGSAIVVRRGAVLGGMRRGKIRIVNLAGGPAPQGFVRGCEHRNGSWGGVLVCRGRDLRFLVHDGTWRLRLRGRGIDVSGVVRGRLSLGPLSAAVGSSGSYSIGDGPRRPWPSAWQTFRLAA
jgi:hypothetical protein